MRRLRNYVFATSLFVTVMSAVGMPSYADSLAHEKQVMAQLQKQASQTSQQIADEKSKASNLQSSINQYDSSLTQIQSEITTNEAQSRAVMDKIQVLDVAMRKNQAKLTTDKEQLTGQIRAMYMSGPDAYIRVLFSATSFDDFLSRLSTLELVAKEQQSLVTEVKQVSAALSSEQQSQKAQYATLARNQAQMRTYVAAQLVLKHRTQMALADVKSTMDSNVRQSRLIESQIKLTQSQIQKIEEETRRAQQLMQSKTYVAQQRAQLANVSASPILQYAETFMGTPYVWGGTSPSGFDCSGYVQYVMAHFGVYINRTSEEQFAEGVPVAESDLRPGDLVFFSTYAPGATHVGIYVGNGLMIDAEDRGVVIDNIYNSYWAPKYLGARQILTHGS